MKKGYLYKKMSYAFLAFILIFTTLFQNSNVKAADERNKINTKITRFEIKKDGALIPEGNQYPRWASYRLDMDWDASMYGQNLKEGDYFIINLPKQFNFPKEANLIDFPLYAPNGEKIADVHVDSNGHDGGGTAKVTFAKYVENKDNIKGNIFFDATFASDQIKEGEENKIDIEIEGKIFSKTIIIEKRPIVSNEIFAKWGSKVENNPNEVSWTMRINHEKVNLSNLTISDKLRVNFGQLPPDVKIIPESFIMREGEFDEYGGMVKENNQYRYEQLKDYIKFDENNTGFTLEISKLLGNTGTKQFQLNYRTTYIPQLVLQNSAHLISDEEKIDISAGFKSAEVGGGGQGDLVQKIKIYKIDKDDAQIRLENAEFLITKLSDNTTFVLTTDSKGEAVSPKLDPGKYKIKETKAPNGYILNGEEQEITIVAGQPIFLTVVNEKKPPKIEIKVKKVWEDANNQDGKRPESITIKLLKDGVETDKTLTLNKDNNWEGKFADLESYENGKKIEYTIKEVEVGNGYVSAIKPTKCGFEVTNTRTPEKIKVEGEKTWEDAENQDGKRPKEITIKLLKNGQEFQEKKVTEAEGWKWSFENLDKYENGVEIKYTIDEVEVEKYTKEVNGYNVKNSYSPEKIKVEGEKTWEDAENQDGKRPKEITIKLLKNGQEFQEKKVTEAEGWKWSFVGLDKYENGQEITYTIVEEKVEGYTTKVNGYDVTNSYTPGKTSIQVTKAWEDANNQDGKRPESITVKLVKNGVETDKTVTLSKENNWANSFTDLDEYENGVKIEYTVKEVEVGNGYTSVITGTADKGFTVTNSYTPEKIEVKGEKTWEDAENQDGKRPKEITIKLLKNGQEFHEKKVTEADGWKWSFVGLDKYENGQEITYTIVEEKVEGYTTKVNGYDVTNSYTPGKTSIQVTKAWEDANNQDGKRPESITVKLVKNGVETDKTVTLSKENNWANSFTDLDEYENGVKIEYTVKEVEVGNGYTSVITGTADKGFTVTNSYTPEKTEVKGEKTWEDANNQDGKRPKEITIKLLKNGQEFQEKKVTEADGWKWSFEGLDKFENGVEIVYTITENVVEGYTTKVNGYDVTNKYTPGKTSIQVTKAWKDNNNKEGKRPENVLIKLVKNGVETDMTLDLRKSNNWTGNFTDLDEYENGVKIEYTVKEVGVPKGYTSVITGTADKGFIVTNTMPPRNPNTGDDFNVLMYAGLVLLSGVSLLTVMRKRKSL